MNDVEQRLRRVLEEAAAPAGRDVPFEPIAHRVRRRRRVTAIGAAAAMAATVGLATTVWPSPGPAPVAETSSELPAHDCTDPVPMGFERVGDYLDTLRLGSRDYRKVSSPLPASLVDRQVGEVRCTAGKVAPGMKVGPQNPDATHLPNGTKLFTIRGYPSSFRLAARTGNTYLLYERVTVSGAKRGEELLPLRGKVQRIEIWETNLGPVLGKISDPDKVRKVADGIADARVDTDYSWKNPSYFLKFVLNDGTTTYLIRRWDPGQSHLDYIALPPDANAILNSAL